MNVSKAKFFVPGFFGLLGVLLIFLFVDTRQPDQNRMERIRSSLSPKSSLKMKKGRADYFFRLMRDPATNRVPVGIRQKELKFARDLARETAALQKTFSAAENLNWKEAGPNDVGGRTRALAIDKTNPNTILAGGVSGGIWKSTDKGASWEMKSTTSQVLSVTSIAQDPRPGQTSTWYYATGELDGNSAVDRGGSASLTGGGIYKSTNNGDTWTLLPATADNDLTRFNTQYDYISKIVVSPASGAVFAASNAFGIIKSADGGTSFSHVMGAVNDHKYVDVAVTASGTVIAALSSGWNATPANQPGVYKSVNEGQGWTSITPASLPAYHERSVLALAPSNGDIVYLLTNTGQKISEKYDDVRFHKITISSGASLDRSANMPNFGNDFEDYLNTQSNYNLVMAVKPDDENFVVIGATSMFRSTDGFTTKPSDAKMDWIGGYNLNSFMYPNLHADIHSFAFDPTNPNSVWWGHDGGLSYTANITTRSYEQYFPWENKNNSYNVTQFYMITIPDESGDTRILGGTQDNGSPFFRFDGTTTASLDISTGDGAYAYLGDSFAYTSAQNGAVLRVDYDGSKNPSRENGWSYISPKDATDQQFINPFVVDPNDENILIYPAGNVLWRNNQLNSLPYNPTFSSGITDGWTKLDNFTVPEGYALSTMVMSHSSPAHRLYYGASNINAAPKLYRLDNAHTATGGAAELSIAGAASGAYLHNIAVNPDNGDEILAVLSNYNVTGIYHSSNGGQTFTAVEGNLEGNSNNPGPSIRAATILPYNQVTRYLVATSTGVYSTTSLNGNSTTWTQEGAAVIGNVVVNSLASRKSDGRVAAGTHGRGIFVSDGSQSGTALAAVDVEQLTLQASPGGTGTTSFELQNSGTADLSYSISISTSIAKQMQKPAASEYMIYRKNPNSQSRRKPLNMAKSGQVPSKIPLSTAASAGSGPSHLSKILGDDVLILDDGGDTPDAFLGFGNGNDFSWLNEFNLGQTSFSLEGFNFYMKTETAFSNDVYVAVYDQNETVVAEGNLNLPLSENGGWFTITLSQAIAFDAGATFYISVGTDFSFINYPAGVDVNAAVPNKSFYFDGVSWINLNAVSGYENGAFLLRATGTLGSDPVNADPVAIAQLSKAQADVNESITFDASQSYDTDGQITAYSWDFGDGSGSDQKIASHAYSQANTYTYSLTVTDDKGATGTTSAQVTISEPTIEAVTAEPASGTIAPGGSQTITLTLDAAELQDGNFTGQVNITSNGGNISIPIDIVVDIEETEALPDQFSLAQNYPNPFNPTTAITYNLPTSSRVNLSIFNMLGEKVATLVSAKQSPGKHKVEWNAAGFASAVYFYRLETDKGFMQSKKLILLK